MSKLVRFASTAIHCALLSGTVAFAQSMFPPPSRTLYDAPHKEPKSGVSLQGNKIIIQSGVGTPSTINVLSFSADGKLLAAGKDFGRIVIWELPSGNVARVIDSQQKIVSALAISPDHGLLASAGSEDQPVIAIWDLRTGKLQSRFPVGHPAVQSITFSADGHSLIVRENGFAYVLDALSGKRVDMPGERLPVLSLDGAELLSTDGKDFVLRRSSDWQIERRFSAPSKNSWPLAIDSKQDLYVYGDFTEKQNFFAAKLSTNEPIEFKGAKLPKFNPSMSFFTTIIPGQSIVVGHNDGVLWGWNVITGKTCTSPILYSESGQLSPDGQALAGSVDNGIFATNKITPGVELWSTSDPIKSCGLASDQ